MERNHGLADLTLVNKYFPVANYSYPRNESIGYQEPRTIADRVSLGSDASTPGLVDDKSDSDVSFSSFDDEHNYELRAAELWDSFWAPPTEEVKQQTRASLQRKQYPIFINTPQADRQKRERVGDRPSKSSWPLNETAAAATAAAAQKTRNRRPAATYSAFPKPKPLPPRANPISPSWQSSRPREPPKRPLRPERSLEICIAQFSYDLEPVSVSAPLIRSELEVMEIEEAHPLTFQRPSTATSTHRADNFAMSLPSPRIEIQRPTTSHDIRRVESAVEVRRPTTPQVYSYSGWQSATTPSRNGLTARPPTPYEPEGAPAMYSPAGTVFLTEPNARDTYFLHPAFGQRTLPTFSEPSTPMPLETGLEPHSVFEDDSDDEDERGEGGNRRSKRFFRFHKRSVSDLRRWRRSGDADTRQQRTRTRTNTAPSSPAEFKRPTSVFHRMLGRRNS